MKGIGVLTRQQLEDQDVVRLRKKLVRNIARGRNRIKSVLNYYGIKVPEDMGKRRIGKRALTTRTYPIGARW